MTVSRAGVLNALPDFAAAGTFLVTWIAPDTLGSLMLRHLVLVMLLEFLVVHSAAFMGSVMVSHEARSRRGIGIVVLGAFYSLFAGGMALAFHSWWPLTAFWVLTLNRLLGVLLGQVPDEEQKAFIMRGWVASTVFYLGACFVTVILPIPALGVTPQVVAAQHLVKMSGLWVDQPQRALAFGFLYFALTGWSDLGAHAWARGLKPKEA